MIPMNAKFYPLYTIIVLAAIGGYVVGHRYYDQAVRDLKTPITAATLFNYNGNYNTEDYNE
jgi:hypothetical protein